MKVLTRLALWGLLCCSNAFAATPSNAAPSEEAKAFAALPWQAGPGVGQLGTRASIKIPAGYSFLGKEGTDRFNELAHNLPDGKEWYLLAPDNGPWVAFFAFTETGYINDDEKIDAAEILDSVREGTKAANVELKSRGWDTQSVVGWSAEPKYDPQIKSLAWAIAFRNEKTGENFLNYNTRLLGRKGVIEVVVTAPPQALDASVAGFKSTLGGFDFAAGERYAEYKPGDHVAEYGLAALITGGAVAVAAKKGFFGVILGFLAAAWKFIAVGVLALGAWFKSLFSGKDKPRK